MLIETIPDKEKAISILRMVETTLEMVQGINIKKFPSNVAQDYYEVIRQLITVLALLDGYKTQGEGAHKELIKYLADNYKEILEKEIKLIDELRITRNKIAYDGFFVDQEYVKRNENSIKTIIVKLKEAIAKKLK